MTRAPGQRPDARQDPTPGRGWGWGPILTVPAALIWLATAVAATAGPPGFIRHETPQPLPEVRYLTENGRAGTLDAFRGKVIVLNIWASWCPPCIREMPTLDALQADLGRANLQVVALSIDTGGVPEVRRFFDRIGIRHLAIQVDPTMLAFTNLRLSGLPTTLILDADGRELARLVGPASWNAPEIETFLKAYLR